MNEDNYVYIVLGVVGVCLLLAVLAVLRRQVQAAHQLYDAQQVRRLIRKHGLPIVFFKRLMMRFSNIDVSKIVDAAVRLKPLCPVSIDRLEAHYLATHFPEMQGDLDNVVEGIEYAAERNVEYSFDAVCACDLLGRDPKAIVNAAAANGKTFHEALDVVINNEIAKMQDAAGDDTTNT